MAVGASVRRFLSGFVCQLIDNYTLFYFRFIRGNNRHDPQFWTSSYGRQRHRVWTGLAFERLCLNHIDELRRALGISGMLNTACAWHGKDAQIDLLLDRSDGVVDICEMKYVDGEYAVGKDEDGQLRRRRNAFIAETKCRKGVRMILVTTNDLAKGKYNGIFSNVVTLDALFQCD